MRSLLLLIATVSVASAETYFAHVGPNNIVDQVIVADSNFINSGAVGNPANWFETCMTAGTVKSVTAKNCAGIGMAYNADTNCFITGNTIPGATLNPATCAWEAPEPTAKPGPK